jgi:vacuolar protein sorting-associated protein 45
MKHVRTPSESRYEVFSNVLKDSFLHELADADDGDLVKQVQVCAKSSLQCPADVAQEYFADYWALESSLVSLELENNSSCFMPSKTWESQASCYMVRRAPYSPQQSAQRSFDRVVEGISAVLLTMKKRPVIRYSHTCERTRIWRCRRAYFVISRSEAAERIAKDVRRVAYEQESALFDFRRGDGATLLLVLDRLDDPVTPLLSQWTYQVCSLRLLRPTFFLRTHSQESLFLR